MKDFEEILRRYNFQDEHGHALENCEDYQELLRALEEIRAAALMLLEPVAILAQSERSHEWKVKIFSDDMRELLLQRHDESLKVLVAHGNVAESTCVATEPITAPDRLRATRSSGG